MDRRILKVRLYEVLSKLYPEAGYTEMYNWNTWEEDEPDTISIEMFYGKCFTFSSHAATLYSDIVDYYDGYYASNGTEGFRISPHAWLVEKTTGKLIDLTLKGENGMYIGVKAPYEWIVDNSIWRKLDMNLTKYPYMLYYRYKVLKAPIPESTPEPSEGRPCESRDSQVLKYIPMFIEMMKSSKPTSCDTCHELRSELRRCSKCKARWYCSVECQRTDWKEHKKHCT